jgi:hypothetical protein
VKCLLAGGYEKLRAVEISEQQIPAAEMERMMKAQEVILKAAAGKLKWWEAAEIMGVTDRTMRRQQFVSLARAKAAIDHPSRSTPSQFPLLRSNESPGPVLFPVNGHRCATSPDTFSVDGPVQPQTGRRAPSN